jgi:hypothetical protein
MRRTDDEDAKRAKRGKLLRALVRLDDDTDAKRADDDELDDETELDEDDTADEDDTSAKRAKKAKRAKRTDDEDAKRADDEDLDDDSDLEDDDTTMRRARRSSDNTDSESGAWDGDDLAPYAKKSRQAIPRVGPNDPDVHGRSNDIGFKPKVVVHGREVSVTDQRLAIRAHRVARREGLNFRDPAARLMAYMLAEKETGYRGPDV